MAESPDILKLGLLFGEDVDVTTTDLPEVLSFQHKLIQEYLAAVYIAGNIKRDKSLLKNELSTWDKIKGHKEVVKFVCGMLGQNDARPIINHVSMVLSELIEKEIDEGESIMRIPSGSLELRFK